MCHDSIDIKPRPNQERYREVLRRMTPGERLRKACELSDWTRKLTLAGLRRQHPDASEQELRARLLARLQKWDNSNH
jgi:hypothetical protein